MTKLFTVCAKHNGNPGQECVGCFYEQKGKEAYEKGFADAREKAAQRMWDGYSDGINPIECVEAIRALESDK